jgi:hypothetical protein
VTATELHTAGQLFTFTASLPLHDRLGYIVPSSVRYRMTQCPRPLTCCEHVGSLFSDVCILSLFRDCNANADCNCNCNSGCYHFFRSML